MKQHFRHIPSIGLLFAAGPGVGQIAGALEGVAWPARRFSPSGNDDLMGVCLLGLVNRN